MGRIGILDGIVIAGFFAVMVVVGLFYGRRSQSAAGFFGADRSLPWWLLGVSFYMNSFSALAFVMYSALAYKHGWVPVTISWLSVPAVLAGLWLLALRWRRSAEGSPLSFVTRRFGGRMNQALLWLGLPMQVLDSAFKLLAIGAVLGVMAKSALSPEVPLEKALGWSIGLSGVVIVLYTFLGGLKATLVCDFIQFAVILAVVAILPVCCLLHLGDGAGAAAGLARFLKEAPEGFFRLTAGMYGWNYMLFYMLLMFLQLGTTWSLIQRYAATRSEREAKKTGGLVAVLLFVGPPLFFFPAMAARVFLPGLDVNSPDAMNGVYALTCLAVLPTGLLGLVVAAMLSATMSTLAGNYNAIANVLTDDFYARILAPRSSSRRRLWVARLATAATGAAVIGFTFLMRSVQGANDLFDVLNQVLSVFIPPVAITMIAGVLSRRLTRRGALAGLVAGMAAGVLCLALGRVAPVCGETIPLFWITSLVTLAAHVAFSLLLADTKEEKSMTESFFEKLKAPVACLAVLASLALPARTVTDLSGADWTCDGLPVKVPHTWNAIDGADGLPGGKVSVGPGSSVISDSYLRKVGVYRRALPDPTPGKRQFLRFWGASIKTSVRVNGVAVGSHRSAFTAFTFEITAALRPHGNRLEVEVDNRVDVELNPQDADFTMCGGLYRAVELIETDPVCIDPTWHGVDGVEIAADPKTGDVTARVHVLGGSDVVRRFSFPRPKPWSPEEPNLYEIEIAVAEKGSADSVRRKVGFRTAEFRTDGFYLNGVRRKVHGVNRHEDREGRGWALEPGDDELDIRWMKAMGADGVRLAHGAHAQAFSDEADRLGLLCMVAIPFVNDLRDTDAYRRNAAAELVDIVCQFKNHPSVVWWDLYNEIYNSVHHYEEGFQEETLERMCRLLKETDPSRTVLATTSFVDKKRLNAIPEQLNFNIYPGWYDPATLGEWVDAFMATNGRPIMALGEYGAGGSVYRHENPVSRRSFAGPLHSEEYQLLLHMEDWREIAARDFIWGSFIWNMFDFAADARDEGDHAGRNDKGLVTRDRVTAKDAFFFYKANWNPEPMLHLAGKRLKKASGERIDVIGFSNRTEPVVLLVNGREVGRQTPDAFKTVRWPGVKLALDANTVELRCADRVETMEVFR